MNPKISIVTVCYNAVETIESTILSVINQTYENIEYIIIDGGSADGTVEIIRKYSNKISFWVSEPDNGIYDAMNKALDHVTGEWVNFMNSGDSFVNENVLQIVFGNGSNHEQAKVLYGKSIIEYRWGTYEVTPCKIDKITTGMIFVHQSSFVRSAYQKSHKFNLKYTIAADYAMFKELYDENPRSFEYVPITVAVFDAKNGISSRQKNKMHSEIQRISPDKSVILTIKLRILNSCSQNISDKLRSIRNLFRPRYRKIRT